MPRILLIGLLLGGCTATANVVGIVGPGDTVYRGTAVGYMDGSGTIDMVSDEGRKCAGPFHYIGSSGGVARLSCDDGRVGRVDFIALGMRSGYGFGSTNDGAGIRFYYGLSDAQGEKYIGPRVSAAPQRAKSSQGTGFIVSPRGHIMTNEHVVKGCKTVRARMPDGAMVTAEIVASDARNDLAVVLAASAPGTVARFRARSDYRPGENVVAYGFPLAGALSSNGVLTTGTISALAGNQNDSRHLQFSAPIQPGNSGGPLADSFGNIIGITTSSLDETQMYRRAGTVGQNINFAVKEIVAKTFLQTHQIPYEEGSASRPLENAEIGEIMRSYIVQLRC